MLCSLAIALLARPISVFRIAARGWPCVCFLTFGEGHPQPSLLSVVVFRRTPIFGWDECTRWMPLIGLRKLGSLLVVWPVFV